MALPQIQPVNWGTGIQAYYAAKEQGERQKALESQNQLQQMKLQEYKANAPLRDLEARIQKLLADKAFQQYGKQVFGSIDPDAEDFDQQVGKRLIDLNRVLVTRYNFSQPEAEEWIKNFVNTGATTRQAIKTAQIKNGLRPAEEETKPKDKWGDGGLYTVDEDGNPLYIPAKGAPEDKDEDKPLDAIAKVEYDYRKGFLTKEQRDARIAKLNSMPAGTTFTVDKDGNMVFSTGGSSKEPGTADINPPKGYMWVDQEDPERGGWAVKPIPNSPAAKKEEENRKKIEQQENEFLKQYDVVTKSVDQAIEETGVFTAGFIGNLFAKVPGTPAFDLKETIDTIKANIGFDKLQKMREASPTGGALGQVSERELAQLERVLGSLEQAQSPGQLADKLAQIKFHYDNWKDAVDKARAERRAKKLNPETIREATNKMSGQSDLLQTPERAAAQREENMPITPEQEAADYFKYIGL